MKKLFKLLCVCMALTLGACVPMLPGSSAGSSTASSVNGNSSSSIQSNSSSSNSSNSSNSSSSSNGSSSGAQDCAHKDNNNDGKCDSCYETVTVTFDFISVNDIHGKFSDTDAQPGVDEMTTYFNQTRQNNPNTIVLSTGDAWQGTAESGLTFGKLMTEWMNEAGFVAMTLGNHEYDWGEEYIVENEKVAEFPFLACNIYDVDTNRLVDYCQPSLLIEQSGVQIGIVGAIGDCYSSIASDYTKGIYFKTGYQLTTLVKEESTKLRNQGADFIIYAIHDGYSEYDDELSEGGYVDVVFEGHTHQNYVNKDAYGVYHLQGGGDNDGITHVNATINPYSGKNTVNTAKYLPSSVYKNLADDPVVEELEEKYAETITKANQVLGKNDTIRNSNTLRQVAAELYAKKGEELWGDKYNIVLGGGYMSVRSPYELASGTVKYSDLYTLFPFNNELVLCSVSGATLKSRFLSLPKNYFIGLTEYGESIQNNIVNTQTYYIVVDTYSSTYASNGCTEIVRNNQEIYARDVLADYIKAGNFTTDPTPVVPETPVEPETPTTPTVKQSTIAEVLAIGGGLGQNKKTTDLYEIKGTVTQIYHTTYGNMTICDDNGNTLYVYGVKDSKGNNYASLSYPPRVGDTVILRGVVMNYYNATNGESKVELFEPTYIRTTANGQVYDLTSIPEINNVAQSGTPNVLSQDAYYVKGTITNIASDKYGNITIQDDNGNTLYIYGVYIMNGTAKVRWDAMEYQPQVGDTVVLYGHVTYYVNDAGTYSIVEMKDGIIQ